MLQCIHAGSESTKRITWQGHRLMKVVYRSSHDPSPYMFNWRAVAASWNTSLDRWYIYRITTLFHTLHWHCRSSSSSVACSSHVHFLQRVGDRSNVFFSTSFMITTTDLHLHVSWISWNDDACCPHWYVSVLSTWKPNLLHKDVKLGVWAAAHHHAMCYRGHGQAADAESGGESDEKLGIEHWSGDW